MKYYLKQANYTAEGVRQEETKLFDKLHEREVYMLDNRPLVLELGMVSWSRYS